jgi:hypothetical protein
MDPPTFTLNNTDAKCITIQFHRIAPVSDTVTTHHHRETKGAELRLYQSAGGGGGSKAYFMLLPNVFRFLTNRTVLPKAVDNTHNLSAFTKLVAPNTRPLPGQLRPHTGFTPTPADHKSTLPVPQFSLLLCEMVFGAELRDAWITFLCTQLPTPVTRRLFISPQAYKRHCRETEGGGGGDDAEAAVTLPIHVPGTCRHSIPNPTAQRDILASVTALEGTLDSHDWKRVELVYGSGSACTYIVVAWDPCNPFDQVWTDAPAPPSTTSTAPHEVEVSKLFSRLHAITENETVNRLVTNLGHQQRTSSREAPAAAEQEERMGATTTGGGSDYDDDHNRCAPPPHRRRCQTPPLTATPPSKVRKTHTEDDDDIVTLRPCYGTDTDGDPSRCAVPCVHPSDDDDDATAVLPVGSVVRVSHFTLK